MTNPQQPSLFQRAKQSIITAYESTKAFFQTKLEYFQPKLKKFTTITEAATSATSTFSALPILEVALTTVAAAPLFNFLVPDLLYSPYFYYPVIIGICALTGYMKYQELIERAKLDHKITENETINQRLTKTIKKLEKTLIQNQRSLTELEKKCAPTSKIIAPLKQARTKVMPRRSERLAIKTQCEFGKSFF